MADVGSLGQSFSPLDNNNLPPWARPGGANGTGGVPMGITPIQLLQLRMPHLYGAAPSPLIGAGPSSAPLGFNVQELVRRLLGQPVVNPMPGNAGAGVLGSNGSAPGQFPPMGAIPSPSFQYTPPEPAPQRGPTEPVAPPKINQPVAGGGMIGQQRPAPFGGGGFVRGGRLE